MAFFEKIGSFAKNVGDKTNTMLEINKIHSKISAEKSKINAEKFKLGEYYWNLYSQGEELQGDAAEICTLIKGYYDNIEVMEAQVQELKEKKPEEVVDEASEGTVPPPFPGTIAPPPLPETIVCPVCGCTLAKDAKYCPQCGAKIVPPELQHTETISCVECGYTLAREAKFCPQCGAPVIDKPNDQYCPQPGMECGTPVANNEEDIPPTPPSPEGPQDQYCPQAGPDCGTTLANEEKSCPQCGMECGTAAQFCGRCGAKLV